MPEVILTAHKVGKRFPGVVALADVDFDLHAGEVHALLGENGAGKSTFIKIVTGAYRRDDGEVHFNGQAVDFKTPAEARNAGIAAVYQEFSQVRTLTVAENIFLGEWPRVCEFIDWRTMAANARKLLDSFHVDIDPHAPLSELGVATRQIVEIVKAVHHANARVLIMDEPTSALSDADVALLFQFIERLKANGVAIVYISHRLNEIVRIADRVTVFRNGRKIATVPAAGITVDDIVTMMIGRDLKDHYPAKPAPGTEAAFAARNLTSHRLKDIAFEARRGEILGIVGLLGAGKTETLEAIFGANGSTGSVTIGGKSAAMATPRAAIAAGFGLIPENRKEQGLVLGLSSTFNISLTVLSKLGFPFLNLRREATLAKDFIARMSVSPPDPDAQVINLSGGNQQKIVISKWLAKNVDILLFDEPTRGIDVGAKFQIYSMIAELARQGKCIVVSSSEVEEIVGICTRVLVLDRGRIARELQGTAINVGSVIEAMSPVLVSNTTASEGTRHAE